MSDIVYESRVRTLAEAERTRLTKLLTEPTYSELIDERAAAVERLRREATRIERLSPGEFLAEGIRVESLRSDRLAARLARAGYIALRFDANVPEWRLSYDRGEGTASVEAIAAILNGSADR